MDGSFNGILIFSLCCGVQFSPLIKLKFSVTALPDLFLKPDGKPKKINFDGFDKLAFIYGIVEFSGL